MEQETSNNLLLSFETATEKLQKLEKRDKKFTKKIESRNRLVKELEATINELTQQVKSNKLLS